MFSKIKQIESFIDFRYSIPDDKEDIEELPQFYLSVILSNPQYNARETRANIFRKLIEMIKE